MFVTHCTASHDHLNGLHRLVLLHQTSARVSSCTLRATESELVVEAFVSL